MADLDNSDTSKIDDNIAPGSGVGEASPEIVASGAVTLDSLQVDAPPVEGAILNRDGTVRKKPGRKPGQKNGMKATEVTPAETATLSPKTPQTPAAKKAVRLGCDQTARAILGTAVGAMRELVGPEWDFQSQEEADMMRLALGAYIEAKGGGEMSPEIAMALATSGYAFPRFAHQNTRDKFGAFFGKAWAGFKSLFKR